MDKNEFYKHVDRDRVGAVLEDLESPCYVYFPEIIEDQVRRLRQALGDRFDLKYAVKANPHSAFLSKFAELGVGADVASAGELRAALSAGVPASEIEFSGPGKNQRELELAIESEIASINAESIDEIDRIAEIARRLDRTARVGVRLNPGKPKGRSGMQMTGDTQFGIWIDSVPDALSAIEKHRDVLQWTGFHAHTASQELDAQAIIDNVRRSLEAICELSQQMSQPLRKVNLGGGLGVNYFAGQNRLDLAALGSGLKALLAEDSFRTIGPDVRLLFEPGRFLSAECGLFVTRVLYRKRGQTKEYAVADGGMNANYVLAGGMGQVIRRNFALDVLGKGAEVPREPHKIEIAGPLCTPQDLLATGVEIDHEVHVGDTLVFFNCGAYGPSASPVDFLSHPRPAEYVVDTSGNKQ